MNAPPKLSVVEQIRARDGDHCWLCGGKLDFAAAPNSKKAPTKEHLLAKSLGGTDALANLVLCHPGCNRMLGDRPVGDKEKIRAKMAANRAKVAAKKAGASLPKAAVPAPLSPSSKTVKKADPRVDRLKAQLRRWQLFGLASAGSTLLMIGAFIGFLLARW